MGEFRRIPFIVSALTGEELSGGNVDVTSIYSVLTKPHLGACESKNSPIFKCPSYDKFRNHLISVISDWDSKDQLIFYFSGHGEDIRNEYYLRFSESKFDLFPFTELLRLFDQALVKRAIIILDACYSGVALDHGRGRKSVGKSLEKVKEKDLPSGIAIIASSRPSQESYEVEDGSMSVFTRLFCEGIEHGVGWETPDGLISVSDIVKYIQTQLDENEEYKGFNQDPVFSIDKANRDIWIAHNRSGKTQKPPHSEPEAIQVLYSGEEYFHHLENSAYEDRPCMNDVDTDLENLDWDLINSYAQIEEVRINSRNRHDILSQLNLIANLPMLGKTSLKQAAILCFHEKPHSLFPHAKARLIAGDVTSSSFVNEDIRGPLSRQYDLLLRKTIEELNTISSFSQDGTKVVNALEIDERLIRELLSNAIVHRDYSVENSEVTVKISNDYVEIMNPGKFPEHLSWEKLVMADGYSYKRNPLIANILRNLSVAELAYRGFNIVKKYIEEKGEDYIRYIEDTESTIIRIKRKSPQYHSGKSINYISEKIENYRKLGEYVYRIRNLLRDIIKSNNFHVEEMLTFIEYVDEFAEQIYIYRLDLQRDKIFDLLHDYKNETISVKNLFLDIVHTKENNIVDKALLSKIRRNFHDSYSRIDNSYDKIMNKLNAVID